MRRRSRHWGGNVAVGLHKFAESVGGVDLGPVWIVGHQSRVSAPEHLRQVSAPAGIVELQPDEMTVVCGAGTPINELQIELRKVGQYVNLPLGQNESGTVGGALAEGRSDIYRLGRGPVRDTLLQVRYVNHDGLIVTAGGPTVKNVSGFDLCRLMVGSRGKLGYFGETILRTRPLPQSSRWFKIMDVDESAIESLLRLIYRPASVLWNGNSAWFCIEGNPRDCEATIQNLSTRLSVITEIPGPPNLSQFPYRRSVAPQNLSALFGTEAASGVNTMIVEAGVGIVHQQFPAEPRPADPVITKLHQRILEQFNPTDRLNPGIKILAAH